jgi:hypothetical protein
MKQMLDRMKKPTPKFFARLRNIGLTAGAVGAALLAQPAHLPQIFLKLAEWLAITGTVTGIVSQATVKNE